jgi:glycerophosphoryl diester phosphodiesterase
MTPPLLLGHRGARASRHIPENTLDSFELCLQQGCDGFEFDVRLSRDGQAVICHDASVEGSQIIETDAQNLPLPTVADALRQFATRAFLDVELKVAGLETKTIAELRSRPPTKGYVVSSFLPEVLVAIRGLDPDIPAGIICETQKQLRAGLELPTKWVIPKFNLADRELVEAVHRAGKYIMVWTVNHRMRIREFSSAGVDGIISDETELLVQAMSKDHQSSNKNKTL